MTAERAWDEHRRSCSRCRRQWKHWEAGVMTCEQGVELLFAALRAREAAEVTLW